MWHGVRKAERPSDSSSCFSIPRFPETISSMSVYDKEFYAVVWALRHFRPYLGGSIFVVMTDYKPLVNIRTVKPGHDPTGRRERWSIEISAYDFIVQYRKGISNGKLTLFQGYLAMAPMTEMKLSPVHGRDLSAVDSSSHISALAGLETEEDTSVALDVSATNSSSHSQ